MLALLRQQPRPFFMIFMLEIWERFGFYSVQGILVLYFMRHLGFSNYEAYQIFGAFSALIYSMVPLGGFLGDKVLGTKRTIVLGLLVLAGGYFCLAWANATQMFWALGLICIGNGLFKANPAALLARCYAQSGPVLHTGFTLYYMAINLGAIVALFVGPALSSRFGYSYAYSVSALGILFGLLNYWGQRKNIAHIKTEADQRAISLFCWLFVGLGIGILAAISAYLLQHMYLARALIYISVSLLVVIYLICLVRETSTVRRQMAVVLILMAEAVVFFTLYQQMPTSINLFAVHNVRATFWSMSIDPQSFQVLNPIWIIVMSPVLASFYTYLQRKQFNFPTPYKFALGMTCCGISFCVLFLSRFMHDAAGMISPGWLVLSYWFQSMGELLVSALGMAMVAELVPTRIIGFVMGMWYLTSALAGLTGASVASYTALPKWPEASLDSLISYTHVFGIIGLITLAIAIFLWLISPRLTRLMYVNE